MRYKADFSLYRRRTKAGLVWYYRTYDQYGARTTGRSTGETNRTLAERYCNRLLRKDELVPVREVMFRDFAADFWIWDRCLYVRGRLARSGTERPAISHRHADEMRRILEQRILPTFKSSRLSSIRPQAIETWMFGLRDAGLSAKRVNNVAGCFRVMFGEAVRRGLLQHDPFATVRPFSDNSRERGVFTVEEVRKLFAPESIAAVWGNHLLWRLVNELAAATGMRQGEILAVRDEDVRDGYLHVAHSWHPVYGLGPTKTRQVRDVPLPERVRGDLQPFVGTGAYVFSFDRGETPASGSRATEALHGALASIGIPREQRQARNLTFHSWRHFFNSIMRARAVPTAVLQRVTGHATAQMTEHYTHFSLEDFREVAAVQTEVFT